MSWLARSFANNLLIDEPPDAGDHQNPDQADDDESDVAPSSSLSPTTTTNHISSSRSNAQIENGRSTLEEDLDQGRAGVKEDLSELTQTLTRQLWDVANFLPPPPSQPTSPSLDNPSVSDFPAKESESSPIAGIRSDFAEIGGRFRTGMSAVSEMASNLLSIEELEERNESEAEDEEEEEFEAEVEEEEYYLEIAAGVTEEVLAFASNIAMHPETWLDFPLVDEDYMDDFDMSIAQKEHAYAVEHLLPRLAALRIELCPAHMTEACFWKIYFVLLHSRLNKHDAELLSTPQVVEARKLWRQELQKQTKPELDWKLRSTLYARENLSEDNSPSWYNSHSDHMPFRAFAFDSATSITTDSETEKYPVVNSEMHMIDTPVTEEKLVTGSKDKELLPCPSSRLLIQDYEDDEDDWPEEEYLEYVGVPISLAEAEDVSFSDLEDDLDITMPLKSKKVDPQDISS
ncbi:BSD domain [Dillenia turbinata]|uniref:BSD domain n=1 Tax=Dillenia turbinata TaxID=194707 RepID=A0AAN8ZMK3_9MAGN